MTSRDSKPGASAARAAAAGPVYEQPLNERMRTFLRLDFLYSQALFHEEREDAWSTRAAVGSLLEILAITARGDVRSEVLKELERQMGVMGDYQARPGVDSGRLRAVLTNLERLRSELNAAGALFMQKLRDSEFLNAIKHRSTIPGGTCEFDLPDFYHWLSLDADTREADLAAWLATIRPLCESVSELLWITRENARPSEEAAAGGSFQIVFERDRPVQLLRITLPGASRLYPEVSGSHHRCSLRFLRWHNVHSRPVQANEDVPFVLAICY
jgi:cell division protein ZapD